MSGKAAKIVLTEKQERVLQQIHRSRTAPQRLVQRVGVILLAFAGSLNVDVAKIVGLARKQVGIWRRRWQRSFDALVAIECRETQAELRRAIEDVLSDAARSGSAGIFTAEQVTQVLAVACEEPEQSGRPVDRWTHRELADELIHRKIVPSISVSQVGRYLAQAELQPHRSKYWLNTKEKDPEIFQQQVETVCQTYLEAGSIFPGEYAHGFGRRDARRSGPSADRQDDPHAARPTRANRIRIQTPWDVVPDRKLGRRTRADDRPDDRNDAH
jgi:hypothetical protein